MRRAVSIITFASVCVVPFSGHAQDLNGFEARSLKGTKGLTLPYRLFKVKNPTAGVKCPLILFLHGAGERGDNNTSHLTANAGATAWATDAHQAAHPAYVIAPQCPADKQWVDTPWGNGSYSTTTVPFSDQLATALEIADAVAAEFGTDPARQYITGLSMGGYGTWDAIIRNPQRFAAALPVCGSGDPSKAELIKLLPIWTFHGSADTTVPPQGTQEMVAALKAVGGLVKYTEYAGVGHDAWTMTYANEEVINWLFTNKKESGAGGSGAAGGSAGGAAGGSAGAATSGADAGGAAGSSSLAGGGAGGSTAGITTGGGAPLPLAGMAGTMVGPGGTSSGSEPTSDESGCSVRSLAHTEGRNPGSFALGALGALLLSRQRGSRRRARRDAPASA